MGTFLTRIAPTDSWGENWGDYTWCWRFCYYKTHLLWYHYHSHTPTSSFCFLSHTLKPSSASSSTTSPQHPQQPMNYSNPPPPPPLLHHNTHDHRTTLILLLLSPRSRHVQAIFLFFFFFLTYPRPKKWFHSAAMATQLGCPIIQLSLLIPIVYHPISILKQKTNNDPSSYPWHKNITKFQKALVKRNFVNVGGLLLLLLLLLFVWRDGVVCTRSWKTQIAIKATNYKYWCNFTEVSSFQVRVKP